MHKLVAQRNSVGRSESRVEVGSSSDSSLDSTCPKALLLGNRRMISDRSNRVTAGSKN